MILCTLGLVQGVLFHVPCVKGIMSYFWHKVQNIPFLCTYTWAPVPTKPILLKLQVCFCLARPRREELSVVDEVRTLLDSGSSSLSGSGSLPDSWASRAFWHWSVLKRFETGISLLLYFSIHICCALVWYTDSPHDMSEYVHNWACAFHVPSLWLEKWNSGHKANTGGRARPPPTGVGRTLIKMYRYLLVNYYIRHEMTK